jgi:hypothetical protein
MIDNNKEEREKHGRNVTRDALVKNMRDQMW